MEVVQSNLAVPSVVPNNAPTLSNTRNSIADTGIADADAVQRSFFTVEKFHMQNAIFIAVIILAIVLLLMFWSRREPECAVIYSEILYSDPDMA